MPCRIAEWHRHSGAHHDLKDLIFAKARIPHGSDVLVGNSTGMFRNLVDKCSCWFSEATVVERGAAIEGRRFALSFQDSTRQDFLRLSGGVGKGL